MFFNMECGGSTPLWIFLCGDWMPLPKKNPKRRRAAALHIEKHLSCSCTSEALQPTATAYCCFARPNDLAGGRS